MDIVKTIFGLIHILGLASLIGAAFTQWNTTAKQASPTMVWGARVQLVSGLILWALVEMSEEQVQHIKFVVKLFVTAVIVGILESSRRSLSKTAFQASLGLSVLNVAIALFWVTSTAD